MDVIPVLTKTYKLFTEAHQAILFWCSGCLEAGTLRSHTGHHLLVRLPEYLFAGVFLQAD